MDIAKWLHGLRLQQYVAAFRDNAIDIEVLPELTDADLEKLGIVLGHRKRLLKAIAELAVPDTSPDPLAATATSQAERRQLTVMFVDMVGSTALSASLDPEEMREVLLAFQNAVTGEIARFSGHLAKLMGDGVLAYFGWPRADEDDAEHAVQAGLSIAKAVSRLTTPAGSKLSARVGIATGLVVVGDLVGQGAAQEEAVIGETPNLAARLQEIGPSDAVVIASGTRQLVAETFDLRELAPKRFEGLCPPRLRFRGLGRAPSGQPL